ncbi:hypothetical protein PHYSODRAFT_418477, partial [Phytophthora sojae]
ASGSDGCPDECPEIYKPVKDDTGFEYPNECYMRKAQCLTNDVNNLFVREGTDWTARPPSFRTTRSPAATTTSCGSDGCPDECPDKYKPVMDDAGVEYPNKCFLRMAQCKGTSSGSLDLSDFY